MISSPAMDAGNRMPFFPELLGGKLQRIFGVLLANQGVPSMLSTVVVYTNYYYQPKTHPGSLICLSASHHLLCRMYHSYFSLFEGQGR